MKSLAELLAPIKERLEKATPGPWKFWPADNCDDWIVHNAQFTFVKQDDSGVPVSPEDGALIANAPTDLARLIAALEAADQCLHYYAEGGMLTNSTAVLARARIAEILEGK